MYRFRSGVVALIVALIVALTIAGLLGPAAATAHGPTSGVMALRDDVMAWFADVSPDMVVDDTCITSGVPVAYRGDGVVARATKPKQAVKRVENVLRGLIGPPPGPVGTRWVTGYTVIKLPVPAVGLPIVPVIDIALLDRPSGDPHPVVALSRGVRETYGTEVSPNYGLSPSPYVFFFPDGPPTPAPALETQRPALLPGGQPIGNGVIIDVYDTGLATSSDPRLALVTRLNTTDRELPDRNSDGEVDYPHALHGNEIAGVIATLTPGATVRVGRISDRDGLATDVSAAARMALSLKSRPVVDWPSLIVDAFGTPGCNLVAGQPPNVVDALEPLGLEAITEVTARFSPQVPEGLLLLASAGNFASTRPVYPGAFNLDPALAPVVLSIGAIDTTLSDGDESEYFSTSRTGPVAWFSNRGPWVDVWAPGVDLATTSADGLSWDDGTPAPPVIMGEAFVHGTSFGPPYIAALIAERQSRSGQTAQSAWNTIRAQGAAPRPPCDANPGPIGSGIAVALLSLNATATDPATGPPPVCPP